MPTINTGPSDKDKSLADQTRATESSVTAGVQRKINIGHFESIDIYCATTMSVDEISNLDDIGRQKLLDSMEVLIGVCAEKTREKYELIKSQH